MANTIQNKAWIHTRDLAPGLLLPHWNAGMIAASIGISLLGAFTSTQLMCQARLSRYTSGVIVWTALSSLTFGFCSIWCLHFVAMLACELNLSIGLDAPLTILSAVLAVSFTFLALASDLLQDRYNRPSRRRGRSKTKESKKHSTQRAEMVGRDSTEALLRSAEPYIEVEDIRLDGPDAGLLPPKDNSHGHLQVNGSIMQTRSPSVSPHRSHGTANIDPLLAKTLSSPLVAVITSPDLGQEIGDDEHEVLLDEETLAERCSTEVTSIASSDPILSRRSSTAYTDSSIGLGFMSVRRYTQNNASKSNAFVTTGKALYHGFTLKNITKGFIWSLAITSMHYIGILALRIPDGFFVLNTLLVLLSATISWVVCTVGCIIMPQIEMHLAQQFLFSVVVTAGVAAMHFTGMAATKFYSAAPASQNRGYPQELVAAIATIAIVTCLAANYLLAYSATAARNKLAEIVSTRKKLWAALAQKENAEAAARARSEFIASASHEIRTPLHQLQGYSDLLARTELTEDGRLLLLAIQHATRTLGLITSNVLDWSRLEKGEATSYPTALDVRSVCDNIVNLLPTRDEDVQAELLLVVAPTVPQTLFLDETYLHRILMNLLSNALKFTTFGYILLLIEMQGENLIATVEDTGTGIPESFLPDLFEPFKQAQTRGAQRGTGLGMSIIKQLLEKMQGKIEVSSKHYQSKGITPSGSGTTFVVTIPAPQSNNVASLPTTEAFRIAMFPDPNENTTRGLCLAWEKSGIEVTLVSSVDEIPAGIIYVWTSFSLLKNERAIVEALQDRKELFVFVPCESPEALKDIFPMINPRFVPVSRPLTWPRVLQTVSTASERTNRPMNKSVRFAPCVDVVGENEGSTSDQETIQDEASKATVVLLVEDNKINQRLGIKMLKTLGYEVLTADDGVHAIEMIQKHDHEIDIILMDQSMPRKDGLTATREIRAMEEDGTLSKRRPIIAVTAVVGPEAQAMCADAGTDDFLPKPLSLADLEKGLAKHLRLTEHG